MSQNNTYGECRLAAIKTRDAEEAFRPQHEHLPDYDNPALYNVEIDYQIK
jgi:hypothetical protein